MKIIFLITLTLNFLIANINLNTQISKIYDVTKTEAKIDIKNLVVGQSGIIINKTDKHEIITSQATVIKSNDNHSVISFISQGILPQDAIPTSNLKPTNGDKFVLNHLYKTSLLIVPNLKSKQEVLKIFKTQNFINEDFFAANLKLNSQPVPTKETIISFCIKQQIGTIFVVVKNKLYILDTLSFKILDTVNVEINKDTTNVPFLTKVTEIEKGFWDFGPEKIENYDKYYLKLIGVQK